MLETGSSITNEHLEELQKKILKDPTYQGDIKLNNDTLLRVTRWLRDYHPTYLTQTFSAHFFHNVAQPKLSRYIKKNRFDLKLGTFESFKPESVPSAMSAVSLHDAIDVLYLKVGTRHKKNIKDMLWEEFKEAPGKLGLLDILNTPNGLLLITNDKNFSLTLQKMYGKELKQGSDYYELREVYSAYK